ncbi:MAG: sigma-70 family RNA polymerase sigma factor [Planctomycetota bacterium]
MAAPWTEGAESQFPSTRWSAIRHGRDAGPLDRRDSLERLFRRYWGPVFNYVLRQWGSNHEEAKDLTQEYFLAFYEKDFLAGVSEAKGRFRAFIRASLRNFLLAHRRDAHAKKRSPEGGVVSIDALPPGVSPADTSQRSPDEQLDEDWRSAVVDGALERLRAEAVGHGKEWAYDCFVRRDVRPPEEGTPTYEALAQQAGRAVHDVTNALHWARQRFRELMIDEVRDSVSSPEDLEVELRELFGIGGR